MEPIPGMQEILKSICLGVQKVLLTNHARGWCSYCIEKYDLSQHFGDHIYGSYDIKKTKPNPKAIEFVLNELKVLPGQALLIDDSQKNIESAKELSLHTHQFYSTKGLKEALKTFALLEK